MPGAMTVVFIVVGIVLAIRDPRRLLPGVLLTLAAASLVAWAVELVLDAGALLAGIDEQTRDLVGGVLVLIVPILAGLALGAALVLNGAIMIRRERPSPANLLSLLAGLGTLLLFAAGIVSLFAGWAYIAVLLVLLVAPIGYLGTGFVAYLGWSIVYARIARRAPAPAAVIALGAGLGRDGRVSPLLAQRVALGVRALASAPAAVLVLSGGKGADEPRSEGEAMAEYAVEIGAPAQRLIVEDASRNTEENLALSQRLLRDRGAEGALLVVTSDYHAFRAATLLRRMHFAGHAIGARTARYYIPSALLREFLAILRDHRVLNAIVLGVLMLPVIAFAVFSLIGLVIGG